MVKRRPVIVVSPRFRTRDGLCTVVPLSTSEPEQVAAYHTCISFDPPLEAPYDATKHWVKADMIYTVGFHRLYLLFKRKDQSGRRVYDMRTLDPDVLNKVQSCVLAGLGFPNLTTQL